MGNEDLSAVLAHAGGNAVLGVSVVFFVLAVICLIIYCFKLIPLIEQAFKGGKKEAEAKSAPSPTPAPAPAAAATPVNTQGEDEELVAVITAAIAATMEGSGVTPVISSITPYAPVPEDGLMVKPIKRRYMRRVL